MTELKWDVVNAEAPDEIVDVLYMLLMGFGRWKGFEEPATISDLVYLSHFLEGSDGPLHDGKLIWPVENLLDDYWRRVLSVNYTFTMLYRDKDSIFVKHWPVLLD